MRVCGDAEVASKSGELPLFDKSLRPGTQVKTYRTWSAAQHGRAPRLTDQRAPTVRLHASRKHRLFLRSINIICAHSDTPINCVIPVPDRPEPPPPPVRPGPATIERRIASRLLPSLTVWSICPPETHRSERAMRALRSSERTGFMQRPSAARRACATAAARRHARAGRTVPIRAPPSRGFRRAAWPPWPAAARQPPGPPPCPSIAG